MPIEQYGSFLELAHGCDANVMDLLQRLETELEEDELLVVTGSLYLVSEVYRNSNATRMIDSLSIFGSRNRFDRPGLGLR